MGKKILGIVSAENRENENKNSHFILSFELGTKLTTNSLGPHDQHIVEC